MTNAEGADANVQRLINAAGLKDVASFHREPRWHEDPYLAYTVSANGESTVVLMSGIPIARWGFHRCYIDGNSWMWKYAPGILRTALKIDGEDEP